MKSRPGDRDSKQRAGKGDGKVSRSSQKHWIQKVEHKVQNYDENDSFSSVDSAEDVALTAQEIENQRIKLSAIRRDRDDRHAKPGAESVSSSDPRASQSRRKQRISSSDPRARRKQRNEDDDAKQRARTYRKSTHGSKPGVESVSDSAFSRSRRASREQNKARRYRVERESRKQGTDERRHNTSPNTEPGVDVHAKAEVNVYATAIDEEVVQKELPNEPEGNAEEDIQAQSSRDKSNAPKSTQRRSKKKKGIICFALFLLVVATAVGVIFLTRSKNKEEVLPETSDSRMATNAPSSLDSSPDAPITSSPDKTDLAACTTVSKGEDVPDQFNMNERTIFLFLDFVGLETDIGNILPDLQDKIQEIIMPPLVGCPDDKVSRNLRRELIGVDASIIGNAQVDKEFTLTTESCYKQKAFCVTVTFKIVLYLKSEEYDDADLVTYIFGKINSKETLNEMLGVGALFDEVVFFKVELYSPSESPTLGPSDSPSWKKSPSPSVSSNPTITGRTPAPTLKPSILPSQGPSWIHSLVPTRLLSSTPSNNPSAFPSNAPVTSTPTPPPRLPCVISVKSADQDRSNQGWPCPGGPNGDIEHWCTDSCGCRGAPGGASWCCSESNMFCHANQCVPLCSAL